MGTTSFVSTLHFPVFDARRNEIPLFSRGAWSVCDILPNEQEQMPMEESANMLLMLAGIVQRLNTTDFLQPYWNIMETWAQYLNSTITRPWKSTLYR